MLNWSDLDYIRFNLKTAKLSVEENPDLVSLLNTFRKEKGELLIAQCDTSFYQTLFRLFEEGFILMDTALTYSIDIKQGDEKRKDIPDIEIVTADKSTGDKLGEIASKAFKNYRSHYHNNPHLDNKSCDEVYVDWAKNLVLRDDMADVVFVSTYNGHCAGFASLKVENKIGVAGLLCIDPDHEGKGMARKLHDERLRWCKERDIKEFRVETSINNGRYMNLLTNLGYRFHSAKYILHLNNF